MTKEVLVFIFDGYADWEPAYVCSEINSLKNQSSYVVKTVGLSKEGVRSMGGFYVIPDYDIHTYPEEFSFLMLTGGEAWIKHENEQVLPFVEDAINHQIPIGAICNATNFMAEHGYLDHIAHTGNTLAFMKMQAPSYKGDKNFVERQAVCDKNIITANGLGTLEFAKEVLLLLKVKPRKEVLDWYQQNKKGLFPE